MALQQESFTPVESWQPFPRFALAYFGWSLFILFCAAFLLDRLVLPELENRGLLSSEEWLKHDQSSFWLMVERNHATVRDPIVCTDGFAISEKCPKAKRILVLGDSFVWGHGVTNLNYLWWRQLEKELEKRGYGNVEVIAAGLCGASTHDELDWAPQLVKKYHPDLLLFSYVPNDPIEKDEQTQAEMVPVKKIVMRTSYVGAAAFFYRLFPNIVYHLVDLRQVQDRAHSSDAADGFDFKDFEREILKGKNFEKYKQTVRLLGHFKQQAGIPILFVMMVFPDPVELAPKLAPVENLLKENKIEFLDFLNQMTIWYRQRFPAARGKPEFIMGVNPVDSHPGPIATHYFAVQTADYLQNRYAHCLGPRTGTAAVPKSGEIVFNDWLPVSIDLKKQSDGGHLLDYPVEGAIMLTMPLRRPFIQLNLKDPANIKEISVCGDNLISCAIALGLQDQEHEEYQVARPLDLGFKNGKQVTFTIPEISGRIVADLKLSALFSATSQDRHLKVLCSSLKEESDR